MTRHKPDCGTHQDPSIDDWFWCVRGLVNPATIRNGASTPPASVRPFDRRPAHTPYKLRACKKASLSVPSVPP